MVWWLFSKKKESSFNTIEDSLKKSFFNIKKDILHITNKLSSHDGKIENIISRLDYIEALIRGQSFLKTQETGHEAEEIEEEQKKNDLKPLVEGLTQTQQNIFRALATLQIEGNHSWIPQKDLARELYPNKKYDSVRTLVSDYINLLIDQGLVKKIRKGRQVYASLSERGTKFIQQTKKKKILKILESH